MGNPKEATREVLALFPLSNSLAKEPVLMSQFYRMGFVAGAAHSLEAVMNRCDLAAPDLARLQEAFATAFPAPSEAMVLDVGIIGESSSLLSADAYTVFLCRCVGTGLFCSTV